MPLHRKRHTMMLAHQLQPAGCMYVWVGGIVQPNQPKSHVVLCVLSAHVSGLHRAAALRCFLLVVTVSCVVVLVLVVCTMLCPAAVTQLPLCRKAQWCAVSSNTRCLLIPK